MITASGPITVLILVVNMDYIRLHGYGLHFSICQSFLVKGNVLHAADCAQFVLKDDLEIVL